MLRELLLLSVISYSFEYNVELDWSYILSNPDYVRQDREAYFGYSVALLTSTSSSWALVGAPRANDTQLPGSDVVERGAVYLCELSGTTPCRQLIVTDALNGSFGGGGNSKYYTLQDYGWLGGTLDLRPENPGSVIVSCSPRWTNQMYSYDDFYVNGACYLTSITDVTSSLSASKPWRIVTPLADQAKQRILDDQGTSVYYYQLGQVGLSAHVSEASDQVWLGAPGMQQWTGSVSKVTRSSSLGGSGWTYVDSETFKPAAQEVWSDYFGYSIGSGHFFGSETHKVAGSPRHDLSGKVSVFTTYSERIQIRWEATGPQVGSYFGAALATGDVNADGWSELFVGAPLFSNDAAAECGMVVLFSRKANLDDLEERGRLTGSEQAGGRFGSALMVVGDLDMDGFHDLAVGAPYEGGGAGAVYIYHGSADGLSQTFSQRLVAEEVFSGLKGFGISISRGVDVDGNGYSDFAVGAHEGEGSAVVLRTRPVMKVQSRVSSEVEILTEIGRTFFVESCISYSGFNVLNEIDMSVTGLVDDGTDLPRAVFADSGTSRFSYSTNLLNGREKCLKIYVKIQEKVEDYVRPLEISFETTPTSYDPSCDKCGLIAPGSNLRSRVSVPLALGCGADAVCTPELELSVKWQNESHLALRSESKVTLSIVVTVAGNEQSYLGAVKMLLPEGLTAYQPLPYSCSQKDREVSCSLPNPMAVGEKEELSISIQESGDLLKEGEVPLQIVCSASGAQDVQKEVVLSVIEDVKLELKVYSEDVTLQYSPPPAPIPATNLKYQIINRGRTRVSEVRLDTLIPTAYDELPFAQITQQSTSSSATSECSLQDPSPNTEPGSDISNPPLEVSVRLVCGQNSHLTCKRVLCQVRQVHLDPIINVEVAYNTTVFAERLNNDAIIGFYTSAAASYGSSTPTVYTESGIWTILTPTGWLPPGKSTPAWIYVVSVLGGILILAAIVLVFVKIGFFKRKRPEQKEGENAERHDAEEGVATPLQETNQEDDAGRTTTAEVEADISDDGASF